MMGEETKTLAKKTLVTDNYGQKPKICFQLEYRNDVRKFNLGAYL